MSNATCKLGLKTAGHLTLAALAATAAMGICGQAHAATTSWTNGSGGSFTGANWSSGVPDNTKDTYFNLGASSSYTVTFPSSYAAASKQLFISSGTVNFSMNSDTYNAGVAATDQTGVTAATWDIAGGTIASQAAYLGNAGNSTSTALVTLSSATSHWTAAASMHIAYNSRGTLSLSNGATSGTSGSFLMSETSNGIGTLNVDGTDGAGHSTTFAGAGLTYIGNASGGTATINVTNGGAFSAGVLSLGKVSGSVASLLVSGIGSTASVPTNPNALGIGGYANGGTKTPGGTGNLTVSDGGSVSATGMTVFSDGHVILGNSTIQMGSAGTATVDATRGGTFDVSHRNDGTNIGNTINGNLTLGSTTATTVHLASDTDYANLHVTNTLTVAGTLQVVLDGAYSPTNGKSFDLFDWGQTGDLTTTFSNVDFTLAPLATGLSWDTQNLYTQGIIAVVPEPAALSLLAVGGLLALRRRRN
jgi:T5SS/PEP-CTERM-associated repeat protein